MGRVDEKVAIVTGGAMGIGAAHCRALAAEGAKVVVCDIADNQGAALAAEIGATYKHLDVSKEDQWAAVVAETVASLGNIDILVNNAGIAALTQSQQRALQTGIE